jgi:hypothetical protein
MRSARITTLIAAIGLTLTAATLAAQDVQLSAEEQRAFLLNAKVIGSRPAGKGITGSLRLTLSDGQITHDAGFQSIDERTSMADRARGRKRAGELNFADSYKYNIAAYHLARLLGLGDMMPVTVERTWNRQRGSLSWWVDNVLMDEAEREKSGVQPPSAVLFQRQRQSMLVFAELVRDVDRNKGNVLYTKDWRLIMLDFSRAFRLDVNVRAPAALQQCNRMLYERLKSTSDADIRAAVKNDLTGPEMDGVLGRRKLIVEHFDRLIRERGAEVVLY